jgi:hypothetical protein
MLKKIFWYKREETVSGMKMKVHKKEILVAILHLLSQVYSTRTHACKVREVELRGVKLCSMTEGRINGN